jgi:hypothetical protein
LTGYEELVPKYRLNPAAVEYARTLIRSRQYILDSDWGDVQPRADAQNAYLERHSWEEYAAWHLGLTEGAKDETKTRYALSMEICAAFIAPGSSRASTVRPNGVTSRSNSLPTTCCRSSTRRRASEPTDLLPLPLATEQ